MYVAIRWPYVVVPITNHYQNVTFSLNDVDIDYNRYITICLIYELDVAANVYKNISEFFSKPWDYNLVAKSCRITGELLKGPVTANIF